MGVLLALVILAQTFAPVAVYTTSDPVDPARLGLATPWGRYSIDLGDGCEGIGPDMNLTFGPLEEPVLGVAYLSAGDMRCRIVLERIMSEVPCFQTDGICDVEGQD